MPAGAPRVAVDGVDGVGKTTFAAELARSLRARGRGVLQVSADDFHNPASVRHRRGRQSPEGFWLDSYDYPALLSEVLLPLGPGGDRRFRRAVHDVRTDAVLETQPETAPPDAVLIVDGLFLHRDELRAHWELTIFLDAPFEVTVPRLAARDGFPADPAHPAVARYVGGQRLYFAACRPQQRADVLIDHSDLSRPRILRHP
ncbi:uridine kinase [Actinoplanes sp. URMC 104]|uniref:uridine kinase n=1 Tax=Actinoplanes sp. URMC 104 TaxID=3423409 RepID=UPI003F1AE895